MATLVLVAVLPWTWHGTGPQHRAVLEGLTLNGDANVSGGDEAAIRRPWLKQMGRAQAGKRDRTFCPEPWT